MRKMMEPGKVEACITRYRDCWAGDVRTALCLRDQGILIQGYWGFTGTPPNKEFWFPREKCRLPLTFHHLLVKQVQMLSDIERVVKHRRNGGLVTISDILRYWRPALVEDKVSMDVDRHGSDYRNTPAADANACMQECRNDQRCASWAHKVDTCWLKDEVPPAAAAVGTSSGVVVKNYNCDQL
jgi:hypothetical protein